MAEQDRTTLKNSLTTYFPDNITEEISPEDLRNFLTNLLDSVLTSLDDKPLLPFYNKGVMAGQLHYDNGWNLLASGTDAAINTSGIVSQDNQKIEIGASTTVTKWIMAGAWAEYENDTIELRVDKQPGGILDIYPMTGGKKVEFARLNYTSGNWIIAPGSQSTMIIISQQDDEIGLIHSDCGSHPAWITPRIPSGGNVVIDVPIGTSFTAINLSESGGGAFTPTEGDGIGIARLSNVAGSDTRVDPNNLVVTNARINFFAIFE